jgi:hypothetical protein
MANNSEDPHRATDPMMMKVVMYRTARTSHMSVFVIKSLVFRSSSVDAELLIQNRELMCTFVAFITM